MLQKILTSSILLLLLLPSIYGQKTDRHLMKQLLAPVSNVRSNLSQLIQFFSLLSKLPSTKRSRLLNYKKDTANNKGRNFDQILNFLIHNSQKVDLDKIHFFLTQENLFKNHFKSENEFKSYQWISGVGDLVLGKKGTVFKLISLSYKGRDYGLSEKVVTMNEMELANDIGLQKLIEDIYKKEIIKNYVVNLKNKYRDPLELFERYCSFMEEVSFEEHYQDILNNAFIRSFKKPNDATTIIKNALKSTDVGMVRDIAIKMLSSLSQDQLSHSLSNKYCDMLNESFLQNDTVSPKIKVKILTLIAKLQNEKAFQILTSYGNQYFQTEKEYDLAKISIKLLGQKGWDESQKWLYNILTATNNLSPSTPGLIQIFEAIVNSIEKVADKNLEYQNELLNKESNTTRDLLKKIVFNHTHNTNDNYPKAARIAALKTFVSQNDKSIENNLLKLFDVEYDIMGIAIIEALVLLQYSDIPSFLEKVILNSNQPLNVRIKAVEEISKIDSAQKQLEKIQKNFFQSDSTNLKTLSIQTDDDDLETAIENKINAIKASKLLHEGENLKLTLEMDTKTPIKLYNADATLHFESMIKKDMVESEIIDMVNELVKIGLNGTSEAKANSLKLLTKMMDYNKRENQNFIIDKIKEMGMLSEALKIMMEKKVFADWKNHGILMTDIVIGYLLSENKSNYIQIVSKLSPEIKAINFDSLTWDSLADTNIITKTVSINSKFFVPSKTNKRFLNNAITQVFGHILEIENNLDSRVTSGEEYEPVIKEFINDDTYKALIPGNDINEIITLPSKTYLLQQLFSRNIPANRKAGVHRTFLRVTDLLDAKLINVISQLYSHGMVNDKTLIADQGVGYSDKDLENFRNWKIRYKDPKTKVGNVNLMEFTAWQTHMSCGLMQYLLTYVDLFPLKWHELRLDLLKLLYKNKVNLYEYDTPTNMQTTLNEKVVTTGRLEKFEESIHKIDGGTFQVAQYQNALAKIPSGETQPVMRKIINNNTIVEKLSNLIIETTEKSLKTSKNLKKAQAFPVLKEYYLSIFRKDYLENFEMIDILNLEAIEAETQKNIMLAKKLRTKAKMMEKNYKAKQVELEQKATKAALNKIKNAFTDYKKSSPFKDYNKILGSDA